MHKEELKLITDRDVIVFLVSKGFEIKDIKKDSGRNRSLVYFEASKKLEASMLAYANKTDTINICDYIAAERRIKTLLSLNKE